MQKVLLEFHRMLAEETYVSQTYHDTCYFGALADMIAQVATHSPETTFTFGRSQKLATIYLKTLYAGFWSGLRDMGEDDSSLAWLERWSACLHIPIDRQTIGHFDGFPEHRHVTRIGAKLKSWKWDLGREDDVAFQALARRSAAAGGYLDPMHFEMDRIWRQPSTRP